MMTTGCQWHLSLSVKTGILFTATPEKISWGLFRQKQHCGCFAVLAEVAVILLARRRWCFASKNTTLHAKKRDSNIAANIASPLTFNWVTVTCRFQHFPGVCTMLKYKFTPFFHFGMPETPKRNSKDSPSVGRNSRKTVTFLWCRARQAFQIGRVTKTHVPPIVP